MSVNIYVLDTSAFARNFINRDTSLLEAQKDYLKQKIRNDILNDHSNSYGAVIYFNQNPQVGMPLTNIRSQLDSSVDLAKFCSQTTIINRTLSNGDFLRALNYASLALGQRSVKNSKLQITFLVASNVSFDTQLKKELEKLKELDIKLTMIFTGKYAVKSHETFMQYFPENLGEVHMCMNEISDGKMMQNVGGYDFGDEDDFELQQVLQLSAQEYQREQEKRRREGENGAENEEGGDDFAGFM